MGAPKTTRIKAKGYLEALGLTRVGPGELTIEVCQRRVRHIKRCMALGIYTDIDVLKYAKYYHNWYAWKARRLAGVGEEDEPNDDAQMA